MKKQPKSKPKLTKRHVESLHHFACSHCGKWWTIGDAPKAKRKWFCPWCGKSNVYLVSRS